MLLGGKGGCQQCSCVPCDACTRTCTNPHTGTAFSTVYHYYVLGSEAGNTSDGYLTASGDVDTSDPYDDMDGTGPWYQEVSGSFTLSSSTTRFPCRVLVSFWRSTFTLGPVGIPPPSSTLTLNRIRVSVSSLSDTGVRAGDQYIAPGGSYDFADAIPVVSGSGDRSTADPRGFTGTMSVTPECANKTAMFTISARVDWNTKKRQHIVYGLVRECYEDTNPCATKCSGSPPPSVVYLTISNVRNSDGSVASDIAATYVLDRTPGFCTYYSAPWRDTCSGWYPVFGQRSQTIELNPLSFYGERHSDQGGSSACIGHWFSKTNGGTAWDFCGTGVIASGTDGSWGVEGAAAGSFDWKIEA